ncbi:MAG: hypothetical protein WBK19_14975 [Azonexus sp.]
MVRTSGNWRRHSQINALLLAEGSMTSTVGLFLSGAICSDMIG